MSPAAVSIRIGTGLALRTRRAIENPSSPGMFTSRISMSAGAWARQTSSSAPPDAVRTWKPCLPRYSATISRSPGSSSTMMRLYGRAGLESM